eukprot:TRINITY_DN15076_c0_g2_i5.p1 TRINITY_DN15076_c0_g2~~TRINITY_DN15076_c0_g2_i5.p1  ORF type:complete len:326 (-),score=74.60 TRINITY_DN15076_c0_g2_i5:185-1162(-)
MFHLQTKAHHFLHSLFYGRTAPAGTRDTSFVITHETLDAMYRRYYTSHYGPAVELMFLLILWASYAEWDNSYFLAFTWSIWLIFISWVFAPFFFNPLGFVWQKTVMNGSLWWGWIKRYSMDPESSWVAWWKLELAPRTKGPFKGKAIGMLFSLRWTAIACAAIMKVKDDQLWSLPRFPAVLIVWIIMIALGYLIWVLFRTLVKAGMRGIKAAAIFLLVPLVVLLLIFSPGSDTSFSSWVDMLFAAILVHVAYCQFLAGAGIRSKVLTYSSKGFHIILGASLLLPVFVISVIPFANKVQTYIMFNAAFGRGLEVASLLHGRRMLPK